MCCLADGVHQLRGQVIEAQSGGERDQGGVGGYRAIDQRAWGAGSNTGVEVTNPICDLAFKYLRQNPSVARLLIGRQSLTVSPQLGVCFSG